MDEKKNTVVEFEIETSARYEEVRKLIEKICADHEGRRDLRIKIKLL